MPRVIADAQPFFRALLRSWHLREVRSRCPGPAVNPSLEACVRLPASHSPGHRAPRPNLPYGASRRALPKGSASAMTRSAGSHPGAGLCSALPGPWRTGRSTGSLQGRTRGVPGRAEHRPAPPLEGPSCNQEAANTDNRSRMVLSHSRMISCTRSSQDGMASISPCTMPLVQMP